MPTRVGFGTTAALPVAAGGAMPPWDVPVIGWSSVPASHALSRGDGVPEAVAAETARPREPLPAEDFVSSLLAMVERRVAIAERNEFDLLTAELDWITPFNCDR